MIIKTNEFYGVERYYAYMPASMFAKLENAYIENRQICEISASEYAEMVSAWRSN